VALYILCLDAIIPQLKKREHRSWAIFQIVYTTAIVALVGAGTISNSRLAQIYWIYNRNYPGGVFKFVNSVTTPVDVWGFSVFVVVSWLQDAYVVYRCLIFWNWNMLVCTLPILCFFGSVGTSITLLVETTKLGVYGPLTTVFATCWFAFSISINIIGTLAIVSRLLWKRREINAILGEEYSKAYTGVVAMLVESAAMYSVLGIIFISTYIRRNAASVLILPFLGNLEGICPTMIIYRIAIGRGWTHNTLQQVNTGMVTTLRFNPMGTRSTSRWTRNTSQLANLGTNAGGSSGEIKAPEEQVAEPKGVHVNNDTVVIDM